MKNHPLLNNKTWSSDRSLKAGGLNNFNPGAGPYITFHCSWNKDDIGIDVRINNGTFWDDHCIVGKNAAVDYTSYSRHAIKREIALKFATFFNDRRNITFCSLHNLPL